MLKALTPVAALLLSVAFLLVGNGLQNSLLPVRAQMETFGALAIGVMGSLYFAGFAVGCLIAPFIVQRSGHIRAFAAVAAIVSCTALAHAMLVTPWAWWLFRAITGVCFAILYTIIESWLNEKASNETRGFVFSAYIVVNLVMISVGQMMLTLDTPGGVSLFLGASILMSLAAVPLSMTTAEAPAPLGRVSFRMARLFRVSPVGFMGCLVVGLVNGAFYSLGPVFAQSMVASDADPVAAVAIFMSVTVISGGISQWPLGALSDRVDRRLVMLLILGVGAAASVGLALSGGTGPGALYLLAAAFGAAVMPLYSLAVAHANDFVSREDYVETASELLLVFAIGAVIGPILGSLAMWAAGSGGLYGFMAVVQVAMMAFTVWRMRRRAPLPERGAFVEAARVTQTVSRVDPNRATPEMQEAT